MNNDFQVLNCEVLLQTMSYLLIFSLFYIFFNSEYTIEFCEVTYIVDPVAHTVHTQLEQLVPYTCVLCSFICVCCFAVHSILCISVACLWWFRYSLLTSIQDQMGEVWIKMTFLWISKTYSERWWSKLTKKLINNSTYLLRGLYRLIFV